MPEPDHKVSVNVELDVPQDTVSDAELDLIEAHFSPLIRQFLMEIEASDQ